MRSLFVLSLPRSLSTVVYHAARLSLDLREPGWTTDGEILNGDRVVLTAGRGLHDTSKYVLPGDAARSAGLARLLDDAVQLESYAYKDVVNPFATADWLQGRNLPVLKLRRDVAAVAMSMRARGWMFPTCAASRGEGTDERLVEGLLAAWKAIDRVPGVTIDYETLVEDDSLLRDALRQLYPDIKVKRARFIDESFADTRDALARLRDSEEYRHLATFVTRHS